MLKSMAFQKVSTKKPLIQLLAIHIISPLITRRNNPKVTMVTGMVRTIRMGFTIRFRIVRTRVTHRADVNEITSTPGISQAMPVTARAIRINLVMVRIIK